MNAGSSTVDLGSVAALGSIDIELNAGSLGLSLPRVSTHGTIQANAGAVKLCAAEGTALRLHTGESILASYDYAGHGLVQDGSTWSTPGYDTRGDPDRAGHARERRVVRPRSRRRMRVTDDAG